MLLVYITILNSAVLEMVRKTGFKRVIIIRHYTLVSDVTEPNEASG